MLTACWLIWAEFLLIVPGTEWPRRQCLHDEKCLGSLKMDGWKTIPFLLGLGAARQVKSCWVSGYTTYGETNFFFFQECPSDVANCRFGFESSTNKWIIKHPWNVMESSWWQLLAMFSLQKYHIGYLFSCFCLRLFVNFMLSLRKVRRVRNLYVKYFSIGREQLGVSESFDEATWIHYGCQKMLGIFWLFT